MFLLRASLSETSGFITFLDEHSNVYNVINALLCLCSCFYLQVFVVNYFLRFSGIFFLGIEGWVGGVYRIQTCLDFFFCNIYKAPYTRSPCGYR